MPSVNQEVSVSNLTRLGVYALLLVGIIALPMKDGFAQRRVRFSVEIEGIALKGAFHSIENFSQHTEVVKYQDGDDLVLRKRPGRTSAPDLVLVRSASAQQELAGWYQKTKDGKIDRKSMIIKFKNSSGAITQTWRLVGCWPMGIEIFADAKGVFHEKVTIAVEEMDREGLKTSKKKKK